MTTQIRDRAKQEEPRLDAVEYPESDGEPIGETDTHISNILYLRQALKIAFRGSGDTYVAANMLFYHVQGDPAACRAPDVFVVEGVAKHDRRTYKVWEEGKVPSLVIEVTSKKSQVEDLWIKRELYERLGVREYLLFDPLAEYLEPEFQAYRLEEGHYVPATPGRGEAYRTAILGVELRPTSGMLRVIDPATGEAVPELDEALDRVAEARSEVAAMRERAEAESRRANALEDELRRYREKDRP